MSVTTRDKQWYELPRPAAMKNLIEVRDELRAKNLHDTEEPKLPEQPGTSTEEQKAFRTVDGAHNDLKCPMMGATGRRFGRNVPLTETVPDTANLLNRTRATSATRCSPARSSSRPRS